MPTTEKNPLGANQQPAAGCQVVTLSPFTMSELWLMQLAYRTETSEDVRAHVENIQAVVKEAHSGKWRLYGRRPAVLPAAREWLESEVLGEGDGAGRATILWQWLSTEGLFQPISGFYSTGGQ